MVLWSTFGVFHVLAGLAPALMAGVVYATRPRARQNRLLAIMLLFEAAVFIWAGATWLMEDPDAARAARVVNQMAIWGWLASYLAFLGTLDSPLARPLGTPWGRGVVAVAGAAAMLSVLAWTDLYIVGVQHFMFGGYDAVWGPANAVISPVAAAVLLLALVVAVSSWRRTRPGTPARRQATAYLGAFGIHDALWFSVLPLFALGFDGMREGGIAIAVLQLTAAVVLPTLLTYGILRTQLFDIDLKIKRTIRQSTIAAAFVATIFLVSEGAQLLFGDENAWLGLLAGGALVFAMAPLQRFAERVSDSAMPRVRDTPEYLARRKRDIYEAAVESALQDGTVTEKERDVLATLADELGLTARDVVDIERRVRERWA